MTIFWAVGLGSAAILLFATTYSQSRRPDPSAFFDSEAAVSILSLVITGLLVAAGIGFGIDAETAIAEIATLPVTNLSVLIAIPAAALALAIVLIRSTRRERARSGGVVVPMPPRGPTGKTPRGAGGKSRLKRAA